MHKSKKKSQIKKKLRRMREKTALNDAKFKPDKKSDARTSEK